MVGKQQMLNKKKLGSKEVKRSIKHLIREARICAETQVEINTGQEKGVLGFAAMLTIFPVMISISEALLGHRDEVKKSINDFATKMKNDNSWLIKSPSSPQNIKHKTLVDMRNGLVHAVSLPHKVLLTKNITEAQVYWSDNPGKYNCIIGIKEFIDEIERTSDRLIEDSRYSGKDFDPKATKDFGPINLIPPSSEDEDMSSASGKGT
jgi:hypothetical protein